MYKRYAKKKISIALEDTPAVVVVGPRQSGKTTLIKEFADQDTTYVTLDNLNQLEFAKNDPIGFARGFNTRRVVIDEIQRAPELILPIKESIDESRLPGRYLLSGSANAMTLPQVADSLAGRLELVHLHPLSYCEVHDRESTFLQSLLSGDIPSTRHVRVLDELIHWVVRGGFPEAISRASNTRRGAWFNQYMTSIIQKDLVDLADIEHLDLMPKFIQILSNQSAQLLNRSQLAQALKVASPTVKRYLELLKQLFIVQELPAWHSNENKRLIKSSKVHVADAGLLCNIRHLDEQKLNQNRSVFSHVLESYVFCELQKMASWLDSSVYFYHYRDKDKLEVDIVIEDAAGNVIGIEVKASATLRRSDFQGLSRLKKVAGDRFKLGVLLYDGDHSNSFEESIYALPIGVIWE